MPSSSRTRVRAVSVAGAAVVLAGLGAVTFGASAAEQTARPRPRPPAVTPSASPVAPPAGVRVLGSARVVTGTQTYTCAAGSFAGASVPEARLAGSTGRIHHYGGPTWEQERDGSLVTAKKLAESPRAGAIPELLLEVTSHSGAPTGRLARVSHIQRLQTTGGVAPARPCRDGETVSVRYGALYVFLGR